MCHLILQVAKGEIKLVLGVIESGISYHAFETLLPVLKAVDPKSKIWQDIALNRSKLSYEVSDSVGPFFHSKHMLSASKADGYSLSFDAATTKRGGLSKDLELNVTFWDEELSRIVTRLLDTIPITSETAEILCDTILGSIEKHGLSLQKIVSVSRDNPNVNKAVIKLLKDKVKKAGGDLIDYGACTLHASHNAFAKGQKELSVDVANLAICIHGFFKHSVIRREQFSHELLEIEGESETAFLRHVQSRWLSLLPALVRIDKHWDAIMHYFLVSRKLPAQSTVKTQADR